MLIEDYVFLFFIYIVMFECFFFLDSSVNSVDFMTAVAKQTRVLESGLRDLRSEIGNPLRVIDLGQEAIVLSGLNERASDSLKHIKNLYDETKYLKTYLEKVSRRRDLY